MVPSWKEYAELDKDIRAANRFLTVQEKRTNPTAYKSTLERGVEIENDFYQLKAQEWAVEPEEAKRLVETRMQEIALLIKDRYAHATW